MYWMATWPGNSPLRRWLQKGWLRSAVTLTNRSAPGVQRHRCKAGWPGVVVAAAGGQRTGGLTNDMAARGPGAAAILREYRAVRAPGGGGGGWHPGRRG